MKFKFDLLPYEYKSLPRDIFGIVLAVFTIIVCLSWIISMNINFAKEAVIVNSELSKLERELEELNKSINQLQVSTPRINDLKARIEFFNSNIDTPASSWVDFLYTLEQTVPETVKIKDFNPKDLGSRGGQFTIEGEAPSISDVIDFTQNLIKSNKFDNDVQIVQYKKDEKTSMVFFIISAKYKGSKQ